MASHNLIFSDPDFEEPAPVKPMMKFLLKRYETCTQCFAMFHVSFVPGDLVTQGIRLQQEENQRALEALMEEELRSKKELEPSS